MTDDRAVETAPSEAPLWEGLKTAIRWTALIFGEPASLWDDIAGRRGEVLSLRTWLSALEALARTLLLLMAVRLPAPDARKPRQRRPRKPIGSADLATLTHDPLAAPLNSQLWAGVAFHIAPSKRRSRRGGLSKSLWSCLPTRPLAYRFEALIRVAENPAPFARRLARRLREDPALAARMLRRPKSAGDCPPPCAELLQQAQGLARGVAPVVPPGTG
jgi:hypothetical protein